MSGEQGQRRELLEPHLAAGREVLGAGRELLGVGREVLEPRLTGGRELLEPRLNAEQNTQKLVMGLLQGKPSIQPVARSGILDTVRSFLPKMAEAEVHMNAALEKLGGKERLDVENVEGREEVIEMDIALVQDGAAPSPPWTSDSEADSTPSPSQNSYTSDTDVSSSSSCSSSSDEEVKKARSPDLGVRKRPLVQELGPPSSSPKAPRPS